MLIKKFVGCVHRGEGEGGRDRLSSLTDRRSLALLYFQANRLKGSSMAVADKGMFAKRCDMDSQAALMSRWAYYRAKQFYQDELELEWYYPFQELWDFAKYGDIPQRHNILHEIGHIAVHPRSYLAWHQKEYGSRIDIIDAGWVSRFTDRWDKEMEETGIKSPYPDEFAIQLWCCWAGHHTGIHSGKWWNKEGRWNRERLLNRWGMNPDQLIPVETPVLSPNECRLSDEEFKASLQVAFGSTKTEDGRDHCRSEYRKRQASIRADIEQILLSMGISKNDRFFRYSFDCW